MSLFSDLAVETAREALAHADRHGFDTPAQPGHRVFTGEKGIASLRVDSEVMARVTVLWKTPGVSYESSTRLSDFYGFFPDADLLDWVDEELGCAKRAVS